MRVLPGSALCTSFWIGPMFSLPCWGIICDNLYMGKIWKAPENGDVGHKKYIL